MQSETAQAKKNFQIYNSKYVASHYAGLTKIAPCERLLFDRYIVNGAAILDLGVGGGRTTSYLAPRSSKYVGVDYAAEMIRSCEAKFPNLEFKVRDVTNLYDIGSGTFDVVVAAFNVLDYVIGSVDRLQCWQECHRVLKPGGMLIFSSHNARGIVVRPEWNRDRLRSMVERIAPAGRLMAQLFYSILNCAAALISSIRAAWDTLRRLARRLPHAAFWRGEGYVCDPAHGGLFTHCWVPREVVAEVNGCGFRVVEVLGNDYPRAGGQLFTDWYYYVLTKTDN